MLSKKTKLRSVKDPGVSHAGTYSQRYFREDVPKHEMPENSMPARAAYQLVHDELNLDGNPTLNMASFVTTWMEPEAHQIVEENIEKNFIDHDEYPQTEEIEKRCVDMLARLYNAPIGKTAVGTSTVGSSEAIMLGLLAHKWSWKKRRQVEGKPIDKPNLVMGADVHVCWEKFCRYFDVEPRIVPMEPDDYVMSAKRAKPFVDENTICVGAVCGTTFTGQNDPVRDINDMLLELKKDKGWDIPIHIDAASGGFIAPFVYPDLEWDFRLEQVKSINTSGHKFGLTYPGLGWLVFRDEDDLPEELIFHVNYLGGEMPTFTLNFSRGSSMVLAQYYNFLRLGKDGYRHIMSNIIDNARYLSEKLVETGRFDLLNGTQLLPIVAVKQTKKENYTVFDISRKLSERGWIVPAYTLPPNAQETAILRMVCKENFSRDLAELLARDITDACEWFERGKTGKVTELGRHHHHGEHQHLHRAC